MRRYEAHVAGCHLLDQDTGEYNLPYIISILGGQDVMVVNLVYRQQGLMVPKNNPKGILNLADLTRDDVSFVNRQRGSGTRVLLDYELRKANVDHHQISGYDRDEYTHTGVAAAIASGTADTGLGIMAAAKALGLDFVPLLRERYDLVIPMPHYQSPPVQALMEIICRPSFQTQVRDMGGYDTSKTGEVIARFHV